MRRVLSAVAIFAALHVGAGSAQPPPQPPLWSPEWGAGLPMITPRGAMGIVAEVSERRAPFCTIFLDLFNDSASTIQSMILHLEVFFGDRSVVTQVFVQYLDPRGHREAQPVIPSGCPTAPTKIVVREISMCRRDHQFRRGCGLPLVPLRPRGDQPFDAIPVEVAPDFDR
jgi:hypothetical protein